MSKKQARSERDTDLPDWADEVTPSDEVMKKFYAPTGAFKAGPIPVQAPPHGPSATPDQPATEVAEEESVHAQITPISPAEPANEETLPDPAPPASAVIREDIREISSLPSLPKRVLTRTAARRDSAPNIAAPELPAVNVPPKHFEGDHPAAFKEFVERWKRYLYPGQLAVMRELYEQTTARGAMDCFTRYSEIAAATKMTRRNCINVVNSLVERGFIERLEVRNDATGKGIRLRIHIEP